MPQWLAEELAARIATYPPLPGELRETPGLGGLLFYSRERKPLNRNYINVHVWHPALKSAGVPAGRENGMHALRHACAST